MQPTTKVEVRLDEGQAGQPVLEAVLDLKRRNGLAAAEVEHVRCDIFPTGFDIAGGGSFGSKDHPQTKEQADYNLKYLITAALLHDQVGPAQLEPARILNQSPRSTARPFLGAGSGAGPQSTRTVLRRSVSMATLRRDHPLLWKNLVSRVYRIAACLSCVARYADVERDRIRTRTAEGRSRAKARGKHMGRQGRAEGATLKELAETYNIGARDDFSAHDLSPVVDRNVTPS